MKKMVLISITLIIIISILGFFMIAWGISKNIGPYQKATVQINDTDFNVRIAKSISQKIKGLSGYPALAQNEGMLFIYTNKNIPSFWMKDMNFPIDIIWIDNDKIVDLTKNISPNSYAKKETFSPKLPIDKALEIEAGSIEKYNLEIGSSIKITQK